MCNLNISVSVSKYATRHYTLSGEEDKGWVRREDYEEIREELSNVKEELVRRVLQDSTGIYLHRAIATLVHRLHSATASDKSWGGGLRAMLGYRNPH